MFIEVIVRSKDRISAISFTPLYSGLGIQNHTSLMEKLKDIDLVIDKDQLFSLASF